MSTGKTFQIYIPGEMRDSFEKRVDVVAKGNASGYVQTLHLFEAKAKGAEDASRAIVALADLYHPTLARALELQLNHGTDDKPVAQDRAIARVLEALHEALKRKFDPEAPFAIYSSEEEFTKLATKRPELLRALQLVATNAEYVQSLNEGKGKVEEGKKRTSSPIRGAILRERKRRAREGGTSAASTTRGKSGPSPAPSKS